MIQPDPHHPAAGIGEYVLLNGARVIRVPIDNVKLRVLQINHPRHGWLNFIIEEKAARELGNLLQMSVPGTTPPARLEPEPNRRHLPPPSR